MIGSECCKINKSKTLSKWPKDYFFDALDRKQIKNTSRLD